MRQVTGRLARAYAAPVAAVLQAACFSSAGQGATVRGGDVSASVDGRNGRLGRLSVPAPATMLVEFVPARGPSGPPVTAPAGSAVSAQPPGRSFRATCGGGS